MILPNGTIVAIVDGETMRLFRNKAHEPEVDLVPLPAPDFGVGNVGSGTRHRSSAANPDDSRLREDDFAAAAAGYLNSQALEGHLEHVVIAADPRTLGEMRKHFHHALVGKLIGQLHKDLVKHSPEQIRDALAAA